MEMYSIMNVENLKSFKPLMLDDEMNETLSSIEDLVTNQEKRLEKDTIVEKFTTTQQGIKVVFQIGCKE